MKKNIETIINFPFMKINEKNKKPLEFVEEKVIRRYQSPTENMNELEDMDIKNSITLSEINILRDLYMLSLSNGYSFKNQNHEKIIEKIIEEDMRDVIIVNDMICYGENWAELITNHEGLIPNLSKEGYQPSCFESTHKPKIGKKTKIQLIKLPESGYVIPTCDGVYNPETGIPFSTTKELRDAEQSFLHAGYDVTSSTKLIPHFYGVDKERLAHGKHDQDFSSVVIAEGNIHLDYQPGYARFWTNPVITYIKESKTT